MDERDFFPEMTASVEPWPTAENATGVRNWLYFVAALVFAMVLVGGATRLTESGLSIVQWKPISGALPPLSEAEWRTAFEEYKKIPQFSEMFPTMDLSGFKFIFAWEWAHRLLGRLVGLVFAGGLGYFWLKRRIPKGYLPKLLFILALGGLEGGVGWWMVKSGLVNRVEVAQERLTIHLLIASLIFASCLWVAGGLGKQMPAQIILGRARLRFVSKLILGLVFVQLGLGALVAGLRAGRIDNTWPLMEGGISPSLDTLWSLTPWWINLFDNPITAQFFHRMTAYGIAILALLHMLDAGANATGRAAKGGVILFAHVLAQIALGVATLVLVEGYWEWTNPPHIVLALAHQGVGIAVLAVATLQARRLQTL
jgi:cytochrome c oxidase assembly protein subunit 15